MRAPCASKALGELALPSRASGGPWLALFLLPPSPSPPPPSLPPSPSPALPGCSLRNQTNRPCVSTGVGQIAVGPPLIQGRPPQNGVSPLAGGAVHGARLSPTRAPTACAPAQLALRRNRFLWLICPYSTGPFQAFYCSCLSLVLVAFVTPARAGDGIWEAALEL